LAWLCFLFAGWGSGADRASNDADVSIPLLPLKFRRADLLRFWALGQKVVVRWESGKVIQSTGHDNMLCLLERDPRMVEKLKEIRKVKARAEQQYASAHGTKEVASVGVTA
jgi:hypothetical protein